MKFVLFEICLAFDCLVDELFKQGRMLEGELSRVSQLADYLDCFHSSCVNERWSAALM